MHKAGFVNIIGCPNVGKSTLLNALVGEKLAIVTSKAQTTRHRIMGIVSGGDYQIVFSDTPGILKPNYKLQEKMMQFVLGAFSDADVFLVISDVYEDIAFDEDFLIKLQKSKTPIIVCVNKCDAINEEKVIAKIEQWKLRLPKANILPISALKKVNLEILLNKIISLLPPGEAYYDKRELTDKPERFFISEIIREKLLMQYKKEIPYSCEVVVNEFKEEEKLIRIQAEILVERDSQKGIIIGEKGTAIKKLGIASRKEAEAFFGKQIHLELFVKVEKNWRESERFLKNRGYQG
jgi:GTP-binding protein Era